MKIFQVVPYYPPHVGGMEYYVQHLSEELARQGHDVTVFTSSIANKQSISTLNGVRIYSLKIMTKAYNVPIVPHLISTLIRQEKPDVIHTHQYPVFFSDVATAISRITHTPIIVHIHIISDAKSPLSGFISAAYYSTMGLKTLRNADSIFVPSLAYQRKISNMHVDGSKIKVIPYGIDIDKFENNHNGDAFKEKFGCKTDKIILSVGRLNYQKGFMYLIKAMPAIIQKVSHVKLMIIGDGELLFSLKQLANFLGISDYVIFTGPISQKQIPDAFAACNIFVLPSLFESFGISLIEAQAAGKPVVSTNTGGSPEALLNNETGLLVDPANTEQLAAAIIPFLLDNNLALQFGQNGKRFVKSRFSIQTTIQQILSAYQQVDLR